MNLPKTECVPVQPTENPKNPGQTVHSGGGIHKPDVDSLPQPAERFATLNRKTSRLEIGHRNERRPGKVVVKGSQTGHNARSHCHQCVQARVPQPGSNSSASDDGIVTGPAETRLDRTDVRSNTHRNKNFHDITSSSTRHAFGRHAPWYSRCSRNTSIIARTSDSST